MRRTVTISVPKRLLQINDSVWQRGAYLYALDRYTFGISGRPIKEWQRITSLTAKVPVRFETEMMVLTVPRNFVHFYYLETHHFTPSISSNIMLVTVVDKKDSHN